MSEIANSRPVPLLLVEDDATMRKVYHRDLTARGFAVTSVPNAERAEEVMQNDEFEVVVLDLHLPGKDGLTYLQQLKKLPNAPEVIIMTGEGKFENAVRALRLGAADYVLKSEDFDFIVHRIKAAAERRELTRELRRLKYLLDNRMPSDTPVGKSAAYLKALTLAKMVAPTETSILLLGETGAGKEVLASYIHRSSLRQKGPFVPINCAAIPASLMESEFFGHEAGAFTGAVKRRLGYFEMAEGGTIFLDEIGEMDLGFQSKLLRVVETGTFFRVGGQRPVKVDVRIISATNRDLLREVNEGRFRADLYYRLQGFDVRIPPLRERREDIPFLVEHYLVSTRRGATQIAPEALDCLTKAEWPGNVRELFHVLEKAVIMAQGEAISLKHLPVELSGLPPAGTPDREHASSSPGEWEEDIDAPLEVVERKHILRVLKASGNHQGKAATTLGISPRTLYRKLKDYEALGYIEGL